MKKDETSTRQNCPSEIKEIKRMASYLKKLGFKGDSDIPNYGFPYFYFSTEGVILQIWNSRSYISITTYFNGLNNTILNPIEIETIEELLFVLTRNVYIKKHHQTLHKEMIELQNKLKKNECKKVV